jgi:hypothetical protein
MLVTFNQSRMIHHQVIIEKAVGRFNNLISGQDDGAKVTGNTRLMLG